MLERISIYQISQRLKSSLNYAKVNKAGAFLELQLVWLVERKKISYSWIYTSTERRRMRVLHYQIIVVLEGIVQGGDPLAVPIYQHISFLPKTRRLKKRRNRFFYWRLKWRQYERMAIQFSCVHVRTYQTYVPVNRIYNHVTPATIYHLSKRIFHAVFWASICSLKSILML